MNKNNPWMIDADGFDVMYDETITVSGQRKDVEVFEFQTSVQVCIFTDNTDDSFSDDMMDTETESIHIAFRKNDWQFAKSLKRGDVIVRSQFCEKKYVVQSVKQDCLLGYVVIARSCK